MREGARVSTVQTHRVQAGQGEKKGLCLPLSGGKDTGKEGARVAYGWRETEDNRLDHMTPSVERKRFGKEHLSIWSELKRKRDRETDRERMREKY